VQQTIDGGFVVTGYSYSNDGDVTGHHDGTGFADYWMVKLDSAGSIEWQNPLVEHLTTLKFCTANF
jgi:hypothetical protein